MAATNVRKPSKALLPSTLITYSRLPLRHLLYSYFKSIGEKEQVRASESIPLSQGTTSLSRAATSSRNRFSVKLMLATD